MKEKTNRREEISLIEYWWLIKKRKLLIAVIVVLSTLIGVIYSIMLPNMYRSTATIMPLGGMGGSQLAMLASQFGGLASMAGLNAGSVQTPAQKLLGILHTKKLSRDIVQKHKLMPILFEEYYKKLERREVANQSASSDERPLTVDSGASVLLGVYMQFTYSMDYATVLVTAEAEEPELSAQLANWYVEELQEFINESALSMEKRNRIFVERQLAENKYDLLEAGKSLNEFYRRGKISSADSVIDVPINSDFVGTVKKGESGMGKGDGANEDESSVSALVDKKKNIEKLLKTSATQNSEGRLVYNVPQQVYLQYLMMRMNLQKQIASLLAQQYEMAKIEEAKEDLAFQLIDPARVPLERSRPKRKMIVMISFVGSIFLALLVIFSMEYVRRMRQEHEAREMAK